MNDEVCITFISDNELGKEGEQAFTDALESNTSLTYLDIAGRLY